MQEKSAIRDIGRSRGRGDVYKRQTQAHPHPTLRPEEPLCPETSSGSASRGVGPRRFGLEQAHDAIEVVGVETRVDPDWASIDTDLVLTTIDPAVAGDRFVRIQPFLTAAAVDRVQTAAPRIRRTRPPARPPHPASARRAGTRCASARPTSTAPRASHSA